MKNAMAFTLLVVLPTCFVFWIAWTATGTRANTEAARQHNRAEYVRHHQCVKKRWLAPFKDFDADTGQVRQHPGVELYICDEVPIEIQDNEEQP